MLFLIFYRSDQQKAGNQLYKVNQALAVFATLLNDWAAMRQYSANIKVDFLTPWDSAAAEQLLFSNPNGYLKKNNLKLQSKYEPGNEKFLDEIEAMDDDGHNWGTFFVLFCLVFCCF